MGKINGLLAAYLLNSVWQVTVITALGLLCSIFLRRGQGRHRHSLWVLCLGACVLVPSVTVLMQVRSAAESEKEELVTHEQSPRDGLSQKGGWSFLSLSSRSRPVRITELFLNILAGGYLSLLIFRSAQVGWAYRRTLRIRRRAQASEIPEVMARAAEQCKRLFELSSLPILFSDEIATPATLGWRKPVLLIPVDFCTDGVSSEVAISALSHEMAHIRRKDFLLNLLYELFSVPLCFHPGTALIRSRIAQTRELACDEMAARLLPSGKQYAQSLLHIAQDVFAAAPAAGSNYAMGLFDTNGLEERIMNILRMPEMAKKGSRARMLFVLSLLAALSLVTSAFSFRVSADTNPADTQRFVGTWVTKYKGQAFITLKIKSENGQLGGSTVHVDRLDYVDGELVPSSDHFVEQEIVQANVAGNTLHLRIGGHDSISFDFTLTGPNAAQMRTVGDVEDSPDQAPPQKKPWHFERIAEGQK